jgi:hypothetical protein
MKKILQMILCVGLMFSTINQAEAQKLTKKEKKALAKTQTLLQKKWSFDVDFLKGEMQKEAEKLKATNPEKAQEIESQIEMVAMLGGITMDFKADGIMEMGMMGQSEKGTWSLEDKGKVLIMTNSGGKPDKLNIKELTEKRLVLENPTDENMKVIALIPAK